MASVNQTRPHCVNQMGKTHSKPLAAGHVMCESALRVMWKNVQTSVMLYCFRRIDIHSGHLLTHPQTTKYL